jgi:hypothetical protein
MERERLRLLAQQIKTTATGGPKAMALPAASIKTEKSQRAWFPAKQARGSMPPSTLKR